MYTLIFPELAIRHFPSWNERECYRAKTGVCSLEAKQTPSEPSEVSGDKQENSFDYCRKIGRFWLIWNWLLQYYQDHVPDDVADVLEDEGALNFVLSKLSAGINERGGLFEGMFTGKLAIEGLVKETYELYGPANQILWCPDVFCDTCKLYNGHHLVCIAAHLKNGRLALRTTQAGLICPLAEKI